MSREDDIKELCEKVMEAELGFWDNPNGGYQFTCGLCHKSIEVRGDNWQSMSSFPHDPRCAYLIAKDLMTNIE